MNDTQKVHALLAKLTEKIVSIDSRLKIVESKFDNTIGFSNTNEKSIISTEPVNNGKVMSDMVNNTNNVDYSNGGQLAISSSEDFNKMYQEFQVMKSMFVEEKGQLYARGNDGIGLLKSYDGDNRAIAGLSRLANTDEYVQRSSMEKTVLKMEAIKKGMGQDGAKKAIAEELKAQIFEEEKEKSKMITESGESNDSGDRLRAILAMRKKK